MLPVRDTWVVSRSRQSWIRLSMFCMWLLLHLGTYFFWVFTRGAELLSSRGLCSASVNMGHFPKRLQWRITLASKSLSALSIMGFYFILHKWSCVLTTVCLPSPDDQWGGGPFHVFTARVYTLLREMYQATACLSTEWSYRSVGIFILDSRLLLVINVANLSPRLASLPFILSMAQWTHSQFYCSRIY